MIGQQMLETAQQNYVKHVQRFWEILKTKEAEHANCETEASAAIVKDWADNGSVMDLLVPLLSYEAEAVRYAAAADLLNHAALEEAVKVLREVASNPKGFIAPTARLLLMKKGIAL